MSLESELSKLLESDCPDTDPITLDAVENARALITCLESQAKIIRTACGGIAFVWPGAEVQITCWDDGDITGHRKR